MKISSITLLAIATFIFASCQKLLANADPNAKNNQSVIDTQLVSAIKDRDVNAIRAALKDGANPNQVINERQHTVIGLWLIYCYRDRSENAETQCLKVLHMLFGAGAKFQPQFDNQILSFPISDGYSKVIELLINKGADPTAKNDGVSLVELAESYGQDEVTSVLVKHGASPITREEAAQLRLVQCARDGDFIGYQIALDDGASIYIKSKINGETALTAATDSSYTSGELCAIVKDLLNKGANPNDQGGTFGGSLHNLMYNTSNILSETYANIKVPVLRSERRAAIFMIDMLLKAGANVSGRNKLGQTPLHIAAQWNNLYGAKKVIEAGAKIMDRDNVGKTPLDYAESAEMIKLLKDAGAKETP